MIPLRRGGVPEGGEEGGEAIVSMASDPPGDVAASAPTAVIAPGAIVLARHGEPALSRRVRLSSAEYDAWWARYEAGGLKPGQTPPKSLLELAARARHIVASTRPRSVETAQAVAGGRAFAPTPVMIEAPLPPPRWPAAVRLSPKWWGFVARTSWWFLDQHHGGESRAQAKVRAETAADHLEGLAAEGGEVLVLAHGFFNAMVGLELKRRGWKLVRDEGYRYWTMRRFERS